MEIKDQRQPQVPGTIRGTHIPAGTVFTGEIDGVTGPWFATESTLANLREPAKGWLTKDLTVRNYEPRDATLILE